MKIIFIVNALHMQRCVKRINEFTERGYDVEAYGFDRGVSVKNTPKSCVIKVVGKIDTSQNYLKRSSTFYRGINSVIQATSKYNCVYYLFGMDIALFFRLQSNRPYLYEESDLAHTYMKPRFVVRFFEFLDRRLIKKSALTVFTSEGFIKYHFGDKIPSNVIVVPNRLPSSIESYHILPPKAFNSEHLSIGFVGFLRFKAVFNFARVFCEAFPASEFHFYGTTNIESDRLLFEPLKSLQNCFFHGAFKYPDELPEIYNRLDLVVATYDTEFENVRYAEPNKIYESIYFETPIIVSDGTYLASKVLRLGVGYSIDAMNDEAIIDFVKKLTWEDLKEKINNAHMIDKAETLNNNNHLFSRLRSLNIS